MARFTVEDIGSLDSPQFCAGGRFAVNVLEDDEERDAVAAMIAKKIGVATILGQMFEWGVDPGVGRSSLNLHFKGKCSCPDGTALKGLKVG